jgi:hypothetical protein
MLHLGCFPLWGREGVILQAAAEDKRIETKEDFNRAKNCDLLVKKSKYCSQKKY